ncbi:MAG: LptF/LptG family permease [Planctomycetes bacterium]|nr:LptF/LptG family permease [Planctomycetota bacterium]
MPLTLYWYILRDLLKLLVAAAGVLVVVMSFGFAVKPISEGLLDPWQLVKVICYTMPGMLTFALPFAAAFASTLVFFRLAQDNEINACAASGVSYRELLTPVVLLGLVLTLGLFWMSNWVVPRFWRLVAAEIEQDVAKLVVRQIQRREVVELGKLVLYADHAQDNVTIADRPKDGPQPYNTLVLDGVAVARLDEHSALRSDYTAERAVVDLYRDESQDRIYATMLLTNVTINDPESGTLISVARQPIEPQEIESPFEQKPKFLSLPRLKRLVQEPERSRGVRDAKLGLIESLGHQAILRQAHDALVDGKHELELTSPQGQRYVITGPPRDPAGRKMRLEASGNDKVVVRARAGDVTTQRLEAEAATLEVVPNDVSGEPRMNLVLERVKVIDQALPAPSLLREVTLPLLRTDNPIIEPLRALSIDGLLGKARPHEQPDIKRSSMILTRQLNSLLRDITSRLHERAAIAVNSLLVLLLGAVMSMLLRQQTPLAIFFWCFMPTVVAFLLISTGQNLIGWEKMAPIVGMFTVWSGNLALAALVVFVYLRLCRN